ncbi:MAG: hypothetical protein ABTQ29_09910, partial [Siculibacillus sp.]
MVKSIARYGVYVATPDARGDARALLESILAEFSEVHAEPRGVALRALGRGGIGRGERSPADVEREIAHADFAVLVHDAAHASPLAEREWETIAARRRCAALRDAVVFDHAAPAGPSSDLARRIAAEPGALLRPVDGLPALADAFRRTLRNWLDAHERSSVGILRDRFSSGRTIAERRAPIRADGTFAFWFAEAVRLTRSLDEEREGLIFVAEKAAAAARDESERAWARNVVGIRRFYEGRLVEAFDAFREVARDAAASFDPDRRVLEAAALHNVGVAFAALGRDEEAVAAWAVLLEKVGPEPGRDLREQIADTMLDTANALARLGRTERALAVFDEVAGRLGGPRADDGGDQVAEALRGKGRVLADLGRGDEAVAVFADLFARFAAAPSSAVARSVADGVLAEAALHVARNDPATALARLDAL